MFEPLFTYLELFQKIPSKDKETICQNTTFIKVKEGEILLQEGKAAKQMFFICKGILKIVSISEKGNEVIHFFLSENQFCTILKSFTENAVSTDSIHAACDSEIIVFQKDKLHSLYNTLPYFKSLLDNITKQALLNKISLRNSYIGEDATTRYQKFIVQQSNIALRVSQTDIASYLGITKQSLSRIRKNMH
ncbi:Crp/Fnr family transcriptional regulator [Pedobacter frigiditerrae]|uniref:Crp/Fnr family transcriptional regulator n=2 Tax=Pedobacter frigiditerrae TaxID=2530452 RepID=A0A4R0N3Z4_9SPHI|nr:Crp/Fnr family transcriptional regulator [Pedobacter frigiditerrae]